LFFIAISSAHLDSVRPVWPIYTRDITQNHLRLFNHIASLHSDQMHCHAQKKKSLNSLLLAPCLAFTIFIFLQIYDGILASRLSHATPKRFPLQAPNIRKPLHSRSSLNPIIVYRGENGRIRACIIPRLPILSRPQALK